MNIYARQGDLVIEKRDSISGELSEVRDPVFAGDSSGHRHRLIGLAKIRRDGVRTFLSVDADTQLVHEKADGHETVPIAAGSYEVRPLRERGDGVDRSVED